MTKPADVRLKTKDELDTMLLDLRREQFNLRFQRATGQNEGQARVRAVRAADGSLWGGSTYRTGETILRFGAPGLPSVTFAIAQPDPAHLVLTPTTGGGSELRLTRVPLPSHYPLLERGFHLVNEWGLER